MIPKLEVYGIDENCVQHALKITDVIATWDGRTTIIHVKLPKIQNNDNTIKGIVTEEDRQFFNRKGKDNDEKI